MTPAKLWALTTRRLEDFESLALPVDKLTWTYANSVRDPGEIEVDRNGNKRQVRPPAKAMDLSIFLTRRKVTKGNTGSTLAAKDEPRRDYSLTGANCDEGFFKAWAAADQDRQRRILKPIRGN